MVDKDQCGLIHPKYHLRFHTGIQKENICYARIDKLKVFRQEYSIMERILLLIKAAIS